MGALSEMILDEIDRVARNSRQDPVELLDEWNKNFSDADNGISFDDFIAKQKHKKKRRTKK